MSDGTQRRLAAIISADVVGYSRLMGEDAVGTLTALRQLRTEIFAPTVDDHHGRVVKNMGDGWLVEFASVVDAVTCAIRIQEQLTENEVTKLRIGVYLGDITHEDEDIYGDGINIAARLQEIAKPGAILISDIAWRSIDGKLSAAFAELGRQDLKNIGKPVTAYGWGMTVVDGGVIAPTLPEKPSIALLAFDDMSREADHEYFADGIAEEIITALSKVSKLRVIARSSTFVYKGKAVDLRRVATDLSVRYVLEGSVRSSGNRLRITAQLIDAEDGSHIWADHFDRTIEDIFDIQDEITKEIVTALRVKLTDGEEALVWARGTNDIKAWQLCIRATELISRWNSTDYLDARILAQRALDREPNYAYAWATLGFTYWWDGRLGFTGGADVKFARANECAERALALDRNLSWAIGLSCSVAGSQNREQEGVRIGRRGVELYPGNADLRAFLAVALTRARSYHEAVENFHAAMSLNPFYPTWCRNGLARALILLSKFDEAMLVVEEILEIEPTHLNSWLHKACINSQLGRPGEADVAVKEIVRLAPNLRLGHVPELLMIKEETIIEPFLESLRQAGLPQ